MNSCRIYVFSFIFVCLLILCTQLLYRRPYKLCDLSKDPFIFGTGACHFFVGEEVLNIDLFSIILSLVSYKISFRGGSNGTSLFIKQLSSFEDMKLFDDSVVLNTSFSQELTENDLVDLLFVPLDSNVDYKIRICPDIESARKFVNIASAEWNRSIPSLISRWTLLKLNPEPLILSLVGGWGWAVAQYLGSCGRLSVVEDCGERLTGLAHAPYLTRIYLSLQILQAAQQFTFAHPTFSFYLTDVSPDNIAVSADHTVKFIDLEHLIVVDRSALGSSGRKNHTSVHMSCEDCFSFYPTDICLSAFSDHNFYAICKEIFSSSTVLPGGLLHDASPGLTSLLQDCLTASTDSRFNIVLRLKRRLQNILASL